MTIVEALNSRSDNGNMASRLFLLLKDVCDHATQHLKLVIQQLPEFDIHDASHSNMVVCNMESLLRDKVDELSSYELFLLHMSGFLHDCAMALPTWELNLLKMTEGIGEFVHNDLGKSYANDGNPPYKLSSAIQLIETHKPQLYEDFEKVKGFIFSFPSESEMQRDLAERLIDYQQFRNGYTDELKKKASNASHTEFLELSDLIRYEFIRQTHPQRVEKYIRNLASLFEARLGGVWGDKLANDLARICQSHGESMDYVKVLEEHTAYHGAESANLQFVAVLLRIADILHFSHDRAPQSLFIEKMIRSKESLLHWKAKFQGINYSLDELDANGRIKIKYMAYCDEPSLYYFIQEYLDWVDGEIENYFRFIHGMEYSVQTRHLADRYRLNIANVVDRSQVQYDNSKFTPVPNMKFNLEQNKILELLMGVGLYKNKFLCLRELYQNALDACRCMMAIFNNQSVSIRGKIEFGLGISKEGGRQRTYIYCLDNGVGMDKNQITNYFLKIGNSFYKSKEFQKQNALLNSSFKPTSQFGIGILSCFMIGDKLEVTTRSLAVDGTTSDQPIRFSIDGPHEKFYYMTPDALDLEKLGRNGTLIKVYLSDDVVIYDHKIDKLQLVIHGSESQDIKQHRPTVYEKWDSHIYKLINSYLAIPKEDVDVLVAFNDGTTEKVIPWGTPINLSNYPSEDVELIYTNRRYLSDGYKVLDDYLKVRDFINLQEYSIRVEDVEYRFLLNLPLPGMPEVDYRVLSFQPVLYKIPRVLVDGVVVDASGLQFHDLTEIGTINFVGIERPQLSVDRNSITNIPKELENSISKLPEKFAGKVIIEISRHIANYNLKSDSAEVRVLWNYIFHKFHKFANWMVGHLAVIPEADMILDDMSLFGEKQVSVADVVSSQNLVLKRFDSRLLEPTGELVFLGKVMEADSIDVEDTDVHITSSTFQSVIVPQRHFGPDQTLPLVIRADKWGGKYFQYDLVSGLWPIIPSSLYNRLLYDYETTEISSRMKAVAEHSNSISGLAGIDPAQIHPRLGMFSPERDVFGRKQNHVNKFDRSANNFWLQELNQHGELVRKHKQDFVLFGFISPRQLSEEELVSLEDIKDEDPVYYSGVQNGWSFLILGKTADFVILPGVVDRASIVAAIKPSFWKKSEDIQYLFTDGTVLEQA
jgi:molecular chaperone HtpG